MTSPRTLGGRVVLGPARIPEPGSWFRTEATEGGRRVFARQLDEQDDPAWIDLAWERLAHLDHPALPRPVARDHDAGALLVAAPEGVPLARVLEHRGDEAFRITPATLLDLGARLTDVVVHAHERGRPHGHLSPDGLWVTPDGELVIWGFGAGPDTLPAARWWAPERARGRRASGDADQWAIGAILAALATGRAPWRGDDPVAEARVGDATHLSLPVMEQWKPLGRILERALAPEPRDRFPSVHPVRQALDAMRARVSQPSDLPALGALLAERFGEAPPVDLPAEDAPRAPFVPVAQEPRPLAPDPLDPPELPPLVAPLHSWAPAHDLGEHDVPTDLGTSPTRVPVEASADPATWVSPGTVVPPDEPQPADDVPSTVDVPVARVEAPRAPPPDDLRWYERFPIRRYAPWLVGALGVLLIVYVGLWVT